jgi:hypothetical protein
MICTAVNLDLAVLEAPQIGQARVRRPRTSGFAEEVLRAYGYQCAMCGFDGRLGRNPVAIEAAHVRWYSQDGPDDIANAIRFVLAAPCASRLRRSRSQPGPASRRISAVCACQPVRPCHRFP